MRWPSRRSKKQKEAAAKQDDSDPRLKEQPDLKIPGFLDFQDVVSPVFRLDLVLQRDDAADDEDGLGLQGQQLEFSRTDEEVLDGFSKKGSLTPSVNVEH